MKFLLNYLKQSCISSGNIVVYQNWSPTCCMECLDLLTSFTQSHPDLILEIKFAGLYKLCRDSCKIVSFNQKGILHFNCFQRDSFVNQNNVKTLRLLNTQLNPVALATFQNFGQWDNLCRLINKSPYPGPEATMKGYERKGEGDSSPSYSRQEEDLLQASDLAQILNVQVVEEEAI